MRITIDTKHDSKEEIMHAVNLIKRLVNMQRFDNEFNNEGSSYESMEINQKTKSEQDQLSNDFSALPQTPTGMFNMFNDNSTINNSNVISKDDRRQKEIKNVPKIETY